MKLEALTQAAFSVKRLRTLLAGAAAAALLVACGGSVDLTYNGGNPPIAHVTDMLAKRATAAALFSGPTSLYAPAGTLLDSVSALLEVDPITKQNLYTTQTLNLSKVCNITGGTLILQTTDAGNDKRFTAGDSATMIFSGCQISADGLDITLSGSLTMQVQASTKGADILSTFYFTPINLSGSLNGATGSYAGTASIEYTFAKGDLNASPTIAYVSDLISLSFPGTRSDVITMMRWPVLLDNTTATPITTFYPSHTLTLSESGYTDVFITDTVRPVQYQGGMVRKFTTAQLRHRHPLDDVFTTITATDVGQIDIDFNRDGSTDRIINTTISALINSFY